MDDRENPLLDGGSNPPASTRPKSLVQNGLRGPRDARNEYAFRQKRLMPAPTNWTEWAAVAQIASAMVTVLLAVGTLLLARAALQTSRRSRPVLHLLWVQSEAVPHETNSIIYEGKIVSTVPAVLLWVNAESRPINQGEVAPVHLVDQFGAHSLVRETGTNVKLRIDLPDGFTESFSIKLNAQLQAFGERETEHWTSWSLYSEVGGVEVIFPFTRDRAGIGARLRTRWRTWKDWVETWRGESAGS